MHSAINIRMKCNLGKSNCLSHRLESIKKKWLRSDYEVGNLLSEENFSKTFEVIVHLHVHTFVYHYCTIIVYFSNFRARCGLDICRYCTLYKNILKTFFLYSYFIAHTIYVLHYELWLKEWVVWSVYNLHRL